MKTEKIWELYEEILTEATNALSVAKEMHQKKRGKDNDATAKEIEGALTAAKIKVTPQSYKAVADFLGKKGYKVWKKFEKKGYAGK